MESQGAIERETSRERAAVLTEHLLDQRAAFLRFLAPKVGPQAAEDILQSCYLRLIEKGPLLQKDESVVSWFYTVLRHATVDYYRRNATRDRAHEQFAAEAPISYETEIKANICQCLPGVLETLKTEYRNALQTVTWMAGLSLNTRTRKAQPQTMRVFASTVLAKLPPSG